MSDHAPASVLSDGTIARLVGEGRIRIDPWDEALVQPASVDLRLGDSFRVFHNHRASAIDLRDPPTNLTEQVIDPTGAGDTFAGGFVGYLAHHPDSEADHPLLTEAMAYGTALASFNVEAFGTERVEQLSGDEVTARVQELERITRFSCTSLALRA